MKNIWFTYRLITSAVLASAVFIAVGGAVATRGVAGTAVLSYDAPVEVGPIESVEDFVAYARMRFDGGTQDLGDHDDVRAIEARVQVYEFAHSLKDPAARLAKMQGENAGFADHVAQVFGARGGGAVEPVIAALRVGDRARADQMLGRLEDRYADDRALVTAIAVLRGQLADADFRLRAAYMHYQRAYELGQDVTALHSCARLAAQFRLYDLLEAYEPALVEQINVMRGSTSEAYVDLLNSLAGLYSVRGSVDDVVALYQQVMDITRRTVGETHPQFATALHSLAMIYYLHGEYETAEALFLQGLEIDRTALGEDDLTYKIRQTDLSVMYYVMKRYDEAEPLILDTVESIRATMGDDHFEFARTIWFLSDLYYQQGRYQEAADLSDRAVAIFEATLPEDHPHILIVRDLQTAIQAALRGE